MENLAFEFHLEKWIYLSNIWLFHYVWGMKGVFTRCLSNCLINSRFSILQREGPFAEGSFTEGLMRMRPGPKNCQGWRTERNACSAQIPQVTTFPYFPICLTQPDIPQESKGRADQSTAHTTNIRFTITIILVFMLKTNSPLGLPLNSIGTWWIL